VRSDACEVIVDGEGWFEVELAVTEATVGMCPLDDPDWPYITALLTLSPRQAQSLLRELAREVTLAAEVTTLDHRVTDGTDVDAAPC
jgi:hypothetical protein